MKAVGPTIDQDFKFIKSFISTGDPVAACREAGLLKQKNIKPEAIVQAQLDRPEIAFAIAVFQKRDQLPDLPPETRSDAAARAQRIINRCLQLDDTKTAIAASRYQSELLGHLDKNVNVTLRQDVNVMSTTELEALLSKMAIDGEFTDVTDELPERGDPLE